MRWAWLALGPALSVVGCARPMDNAPAAAIPEQCSAQVYADPAVKALIMKGAGSESFLRQHQDELKYAKLDAAHRCMQQKGLSAPGGGVERPSLRG